MRPVPKQAQIVISTGIKTANILSAIYLSFVLANLNTTTCFVMVDYWK
jgi:hypothetical protein